MLSKCVESSKTYLHGTLQYLILVLVNFQFTMVSVSYLTFTEILGLLRASMRIIQLKTLLKERIP